MKEATGELNMTVITIVAMGALLAFFYAVIWPGIQSSMALTSACNAGPGTKTGDKTTKQGGVECTNPANGTTFECTYYKDNKEVSSKTCSMNG